jgi:ribose transport system substrate-binding protein
MACSRFSSRAWVVLLIVGLATAGCSRSASQSAGGGKASSHRAGPLTIAVIPKSTGGEFWETVESGARAAGDALGVTIKWEGTLTETEIAEQNRIIENMINLGVDGIALAPLNPKAMRKSVEAAAADGIPVVIFDSSVDGNAHISFVATDNEAGGALGAKHLVERLAGTQGRTIMQRYIQGTASTEDRARGFLATAKDGKLKVLADPYPEDSTVAGCKKTSTNVLEGFVKDGKLELDGIFACNLTATLGMVAALDDLRKSGVAVNVVFVGFDSSPKLIEELQAGLIDALIVQDPQTMGYLAVETLVKHLRGEEVEPIIDTNVELVTRERLKNEPEIRKLVGLE